MLDITRIRKSGGREKRVFNDYEKWPCYYHLDILAHTQSWKSEDNIRMLAEAVKKLLRTDRPQCQVGGDSWVGYVLGTCGCITEGYALGYEKAGVHYTYFDRIEWLCRCGLAPYIGQIQNEVDILRRCVSEEGICTAPFDENRLRGFGTCGAQQLEIDWKSPVRRDCDVTFRALLIMHYAGMDA